MLESQGINAFVKNRVMLLDSEARAYSDVKVIPYIKLMDTKHDRVVIPWSRRKEIKDMVMN